VKNKNENKTKNIVTIDYENKKLSVFYFLPLLLIAGFVPLIVYAKYVDLTDTTQALYWTGQRQYLDFFSYWKSWWVVALTTVALLFYIILYVQKKLPLKNLKQYYIPLGIYALFVIISTIFSIDKPTALWGFVDMYQGMFVLLSYVLLTFLTINFVNNKRDLNLFVNVFLFLMIIEGVIGVGQYFGFDFFQTSIGKSLILPSNLVVEDLSFSFGPKTIYGTLFNTNFVGSFATLMLPLSIAFLLGANTQKKRVVSGIAVLLMLFVWIGCNSRAGYFGILASIMVSVCIFRSYLKKHLKICILFSVISVMVLMSVNSISNGAMWNRVKTFNVFDEIDRIRKLNEEGVLFEDISLGKNTFSIKTNKELLNFKIDEDKLFFFDDKMNELEITVNGNRITINDNRYHGFIISIPKNYPGVTVDRVTSLILATTNFYFTDEGVKILGSGGRITTPIVAEKLKILEGVEHLASNRVYIWNRTIPMLRMYFVKGAGADNYALTFPQDDFVAKLNVGMDANTVVDKPHNLFLQIATNTGVFSLLSLLILWSIYIISSLKLYCKITFDTLEKYIGVSVLIGVIGYLFAGIFNDSVISVAPVFWILLGLGISINIRLKSKMI